MDCAMLQTPGAAPWDPEVLQEVGCLLSRVFIGQSEAGLTVGCGPRVQAHRGRPLIPSLCQWLARHSSVNIHLANSIAQAWAEAPCSFMPLMVPRDAAGTLLACTCSLPQRHTAYSDGCICTGAVTQPVQRRGGRRRHRGSPSDSSLGLFPGLQHAALHQPAACCCPAGPGSACYRYVWLSAAGLLRPFCSCFRPSLMGALVWEPYDGPTACLQRCCCSLRVCCSCLTGPSALSIA